MVLRMRCEPRFHLSGLVSGAVIQNDMYLLIVLAILHSGVYEVKKGDKLLGSVPLVRSADNAPGCYIKCGIKACRTVAHIIMGMPFHLMRSQL